MHAPTHIWLGTLRRVLLQKQITDASEIVEVTFKEVDPGPGKDYVYHFPQASYVHLRGE